MAGFLTTVEIAADEAGSHPDLFARLRADAVQAVVVRDVYAADDCARIVAALEAGPRDLVRTGFPEAFKASFYGVNLNLLATDLDRYFAEAARFRGALAGLLPEGFDLERRLTKLFSALDGGRPFGPPPGPRAGQRYMATTIRDHRTGGYIPAHFDNEQAARPGYAHLATQIEPDLISFVLAFSKPEGGGALEIFDYRARDHAGTFANDDRRRNKQDLDGVARVAFRLDPGSLILVKSGDYLHRVTPVEGARTRWTACSFMAPARRGHATFLWG